MGILLGRHQIFPTWPLALLPLETKLPVMSGQVFQVLEACNVNAKVMDK